jgi:hypothetical protein
MLARKRIIGNLIGFVIRREVLGILWYSWPEEEEWVIVAKRQISNFPTISWRGPSTVDDKNQRYHYKLVLYPIKYWQCWKYNRDTKDILIYTLVAQSWVFTVVYDNHLLPIRSFSFGHCIVCPSTVDEMMLRYKTNKFSWIFIMLA